MSWNEVASLYEFRGQRRHYKALVEMRAHNVWEYTVVSGVTKNMPPRMLPREYRALHRGTAPTLVEARTQVEEYINRHDAKGK